MLQQYDSSGSSTLVTSRLAVNLIGLGGGDMRDVMALSISILKLQPAMPPSFEHCYAGSKTVAVRSAVREIIYANFKSYRPRKV